jgi:hypothetical protein
MQAQNSKNAVWRPLSTGGDIASLVQVADKVHPDLPESEQVFAERVALFPQGCLGLFDETDELGGYIISHPTRYREPPALDQLLGEIAPDANQYYIHDLAILSKVLDAVAKRYATTGLVSVYGTSEFGGRYGFKVPEAIDGVLEKKIQGYGDDAVYLERKNES